MTIKENDIMLLYISLCATIIAFIPQIVFRPKYILTSLSLFITSVLANLTFNSQLISALLTVFFIMISFSMTGGEVESNADIDDRDIQ